MDAFPGRDLAALLLFLAPGCASFPGDRLERLDPAREITGENRLPAISYECKSNRGANSLDWNLGWPGASTERMFRSAFLGARSGPAANDLHAELNFQSETRHPAVSIGLGVLMLASLGLIPTCQRFELTLLVRVENEGRLLGEYVYHEDQGTWIQLFLLPWSFSHDPTDVQRSVYSNMLLHFLRDLRKDLAQVLPVAARAAVADDADRGSDGWSLGR